MGIEQPIVGDDETVANRKKVKSRDVERLALHLNSNAQPNCNEK